MITSFELDVFLKIKNNKNIPTTDLWSSFVTNSGRKSKICSRTSFFNIIKGFEEKDYILSTRSPRIYGAPVRLLRLTKKGSKVLGLGVALRSVIEDA